MLVKKKAWVLLRGNPDAETVSPRSDIEGNPKANAQSALSASPKSLGSETAVYAQSFDFRVARVSMFYAVFIQMAVAFADVSRDIRIFTAFGALGAAFQPTLMTIILALHSQGGGKEVGRVLGGLSFVQAIR